MVGKFDRSRFGCSRCEGRGEGKELWFSGRRAALEGTFQHLQKGLSY